MSSFPKIIMTIGVLIFIVGFIMQFIHFGKLPGDIIFKKGNTTVYFPIVSSIIVSIVLSILFYFVGKFR